MKSIIQILLLTLLGSAAAWAGPEPTPEQLAHDIDHYHLLLQKEPENARYLNALGFAYYKLDRTAEAEAALRRCIRSDPRYAVAHNNLGALLLHLKEYPRAEQCFRRALEIAPDYVKAAYNLAVSLFKQKKFMDAYKAYRNAKKLDKRYVQQRFDGSTARQQIKQAMRENPDDGAWKNLKEKSARDE